MCQLYFCLLGLFSSLQRGCWIKEHKHKKPLFSYNLGCVWTPLASRFLLCTERVRCLQNTELLRCHWLFDQYIHKYTKNFLKFEILASLWWQLLIQLRAHPIIVGNTFPPYGCSFTPHQNPQFSPKGGHFLFSFFKQFSLPIFSIFPWTSSPLPILSFLQVHSGNGKFSFYCTANIKEEKEERR